MHARASLRAELEQDASRLLEVTGIFLDAFHDLFGIRVPLGGYDQVFVPKFNALAMENPGCVVLRDELLFLAGPPTTRYSAGTTPSPTRWHTCGSTATS